MNWMIDYINTYKQSKNYLEGSQLCTPATMNSVTTRITTTTICPIGGTRKYNNDSHTQ